MGRKADERAAEARRLGDAATRRANRNIVLFVVIVVAGLYAYHLLSTGQGPGLDSLWSFITRPDCGERFC